MAIRGKWCRDIEPKMRRACIATLLGAGVAWSSLASAYNGDSFINIPGSPGQYRGGGHKGWIRAEASDWLGRLTRLNSGAADPLAGDKLFFGGPNAPKPGNGGKLVVAFSLKNPDLAKLLEACGSKRVIPELTYAESSDRARPLLELGPRPADLPEYWEYKLKEVQVTDCPLVEGAEQRAVTLAFKDIEWLNYAPDRPIANKVLVKPSDIPNVAPAEPSARKQVRSYLITWIAPATDAPDDACPKLNTKPTEADVFRYMPPDEVAKLKAQLGEKGISYGPMSERRGPNKLSVSAFPGIVPDPGQIEPNMTVAAGIDLDGDDGSGKPPPGVRKHVNFISPDGRTGIDNQYARVWGCVAGYRGKRGYNNQTPNARRADGNITTLIELSDIDDPQNDDTVYVAIIHSMDKPMRDTAGKVFIPNYTYRPASDPQFTMFNVRVKGRMKNGVVTTDALPRYDYNPGQGAVTELHQVRIRLEPQADGSVKGFLAGYQDWRKLGYSGYSEGLFTFQSPAVYNSFKRNADGLRDPVTGEYNGISTVFEIDTVPAFLTPATVQTADAAEQGASKKKSR